WDSGNRTGTQYVYFKDNMTYTLNMDRGSSNNPFNVSTIVANNERLVPVYSNDNDGKYALTVTDISEETHIYITYVPTVKITAYDPVLTDATNGNMRIKVVDSQGGDGWWLQRSDNGYYYAYVNAGSSAYFMIFDYHTGSSTEWHAESVETGNDAILGVSDIQVRIGSDDPYPMDANVNNIYEIGAVTDDTVVTSDLSCIRWDVTFVSTTSAGPSTFVIQVINGARLHIATKDQLASVHLNDMDGHALDGWNATGGDKDYYTPGEVIRVYNHMNLNADWGNPIDYVIKADLGSGFVNFATYKITTGYTMGDVTRRGYDFVGWVDADTPNETPRKNYPIAVGTFGERSFIAVWNALPVHVIMYDDMQEEVLDEGDFTFGQPYSNLPIFSMYEDPQTHEIYSFVGWGLKDETTGMVTQITSSTLVDIEVTHTIYIILWKEGFYVLNITNDGSYGGTVTANLVGEQGDAIALIITMYSGFIATNVKINGQDFPITPNSNPYTYSDFITSSSVYYYVVTVTFEPTTGIPIPLPELYGDSPIYYIYDGTEKTGYKSRDGYYMLIESVDDDWHNTGTNAGTYYVTARLVPPYIWDDGTNLDKRLEWSIETRKAYIVAHSESEFYTGSAFTIPDNMYSLVSVVPSDLPAVRGAVHSIVYDSRTVQDVGWYIIDITGYDNLDNYEFIVIKGTFIVVKIDSSSVSVRIVSLNPSTNNIAPSPDMVNMTESGRVMAIVSVSGRREGE
ncbi:MAG: hypothetical protein II855_03845, partial [Candidatus Methanomethylophilaceae archaeon]|nr:hypothetical protein [Candidatus Methanomethylophilaceae archaeon]